LLRALQNGSLQWRQQVTFAATDSSYIIAIH
jgi:hypothetical protein